MHHNGNHLEKVATVSLDATVAETAAKMAALKVGCLVVSDTHGHICGIITERDIITRVIGAGEDLNGVRVREIMTSNVISCMPDTQIDEARRMMSENNVRHLPIVDADEVVGMLSARDLMSRQLAEDRAAAEEVAMLSTCLKSIDINEVADIVTAEVPKLFKAGRCILCLSRDGRPDSEPVIVSRSECICPGDCLNTVCRSGDSSGMGDIRYDDLPVCCDEHGASAPRLVIPLRIIEDNSLQDEATSLPGFLCMCDLNESAARNKELISYKARLARDVLNSHLTNARLYQQARLTSFTDALTGIGSRRMLEDSLKSEAARAQRYDRPFSVAIIDLDKFKMINDVLGHAVGDNALVRLSRCMKRIKRATDILTRYGGDEFVIIMPETEAKEAMTLIERLRIEANKIKLSDGISINVSCGVAQSIREDADLSRDIMRRADLALYEAKSAGRNCVKVWNEGMSKEVDPSDLDIDKIKQLQRRIAGLSEQAEQMFVQSIWGLVQALEAKDPYARKHSENVTKYAVAIAETMHMGPKHTEVIERAAMIHDIGKIGVPDAVLAKPGGLSPRERSIIEQHPIIAIRILEQMTFLEHEIKLVRHHHEKWNGEGYPDGLARDAIPLGARILCVADTFDALTSERAYRQSRSITEVVKILSDAAGYEFDPKAVKGLILWIEHVAEQLGVDIEELTASDLLDFGEPSTVHLATLTQPA